MRIAIIGGHGKIALHLARILTGHGHSVSSLIRNPEQSGDITAAGASPVIADVETMDTAEIAGVLAGHDAVVWSAGAGGGSPERTYAVDRDAAIRSMDAAVAADVQRYVMVSYFGASTNHGVDPDNAFYPYAEAKARADEYLSGTSLAWTILAPSALTTGDASGKIEVGAGVQAGEVSRQDVAEVAAAVLGMPETAGKKIAFNNGDTPIEDALAQTV